MSDMKYALFLGCTTPVKAKNYELASRRVAAKLGIELVDIPGFECCGFPVKSVHRRSFLLMAARNLMVAEDAGLDICVLCSACAGTLTEVSRELADNDELRQLVLSQLGRGNEEYGFARKVKVKHIVKILYEDLGPEKIELTIENKLSGLNVAAHYGCHYLRPSDIYDNREDPENPHSLDELIEATGAKSVEYDDRERCCGAGVLAIDEGLALSLAQKKLEDIKSSDADIMVLMCPFCSVMYDENQNRIERKFEASYNLPVLYYPQLLGLALGIDGKSLGFRLNKVKVNTVLERIG